MKTPLVHRSSMINRPPKFWRGLSQRLFGYLSLDDVYQERIRNIAQEGQVIYVMRSRSLLDYLAYNYLTEGGGTRFRQAVNKQLNKGFIFQDYINFKPNVKFVSLDSLPILFEAGNLIKVSNIKNKNIRVSK